MRQEIPAEFRPLSSVLASIMEGTRRRTGKGAGAVTVIYVDTLFLLNALVDYLLLLGAARLAGEPLRRLRFLAGAVLGGGYAVALFLPGLGFLAHPLCRAACAALMLLAAYGGSRRLLRQGVIFLALACALGGGVLAVGLLGGRGLALGDAGVYYTPFDLKLVLLSAAGCYALLTLALRGIGRHTAASGELVAVRLELEGRAAEFTALVDTGNTLSDPVSGRPAMVAEEEALAPLFPRELRPSRADLLDPAGAMARLGTGVWRRRFRLLPYRAVGVERGLLLALRVDGARVGGRDRGPLLVALSPTPVSDGGGYRALIGPAEGENRL